MLLKIGSTGSDVKLLQEKLGINNDGSFGTGTEAAVKNWQTSHGLVSNGIVGDDMWSKITNSQPVVIPPSTFKLSNLKGHVPDSVIAQIPDTAAKFNITNVLRLSHFLAQCSHESAGFKAVSENLNYSAGRLAQVFPSYFKTKDTSIYGGNPEKIASLVYGNRMGNGGEETKDGYKFRGRGYIQLTGKQNYSSFDKMVDEDILSNPDLVATKYPLASAAFFFNSNNLWSICDKGADVATVTALTKRINGGIIGLDDRIKHFNEFYNLLK